MRFGRRTLVSALLVMSLWVLVFAGSAFAAVERVEQNDPSISYTGTWSQSVLSGHSGGSVAFSSDSPNATAVISFTGTGIDYIAATWFNRGWAAVSLDGGPEQLVDLYSPGSSINGPEDPVTGVKFQQVIYSASGLSNGPHTLQVRVVGNNGTPGSASPWLVTVDAFDVTTPDPPVVTTSASSTWSLALGVLLAGAVVAVLARRRTA
jgi:hypothetical protein